MGANDDRWISRAFETTAGADGKVESEERVYEVTDAQALAWRDKIGDQHPDDDMSDLRITRVGIGRHLLGKNAKITVIYSTGGVEDPNDYELRISPAGNRDRKIFYCPEDQEPLEFDVPGSLLNITATNWRTSLPLGTIVPWTNCTNMNAHRIQGYLFPENTLLFQGAPGERVGQARWRVTWSWLYNPDAWQGLCRTHKKVIYLYPRQNMTSELGKIAEKYDV